MESKPAAPWAWTRLFPRLEVGIELKTSTELTLSRTCLTSRTDPWGYYWPVFHLAIELFFHPFDHCTIFGESIWPLCKKKKRLNLHQVFLCDTKKEKKIIRNTNFLHLLWNFYNKLKNSIMFCGDC